MLDKKVSSNPLHPPELSEILSAIWSFKTYIFGLCFLVALIAIFIAFNTPNSYRSDALLAPTEMLQGQDNNITSQLGGIASLAGISDMGSKDFKTEVAQAKLLTKEFLYSFIDRHKLVATLIAGKAWEQETNKLVFDEDIYSEEEQRFLLPKNTNLNWLAYKTITKNLIIDKEKNGLIVIAYEHPSPVVAQFIVENLVLDINRLMQRFDVEQADKSIMYLNEKLAHINVADMKTIFYRLIEEQTKNKMLTEIKSEYIFTTIDPALVPEEKSGPKRALIVVVSVFLAGLLGCFIALIRFYKAR
ncbi:MAG: Wzz/FepE/Etk N-terminal domain-containing protein [Pseudoalteromonas sp.]